MILLLLALQAATVESRADDIVVVARKQKCSVKFADRDMSDAEFKRRSAEWAAGTPVRVIAREATDIKCLAKIAFKLADRGVTRIQFVEPKDLNAPGATWR